MNTLTQTISGEQIKHYLEAVVAAMEVPPARAHWKYHRYEELVLDCGFLIAVNLIHSLAVKSPSNLSRFSHSNSIIC